ncbi:MAG: START domain-containing protein [Hahellaceae bacterium]|nr:START domain-containing protein [Hahellaceae bacterium]MCP5168891.1 START domain-containing protein [Hahellaceae bacterium]
MTLFKQNNLKAKRTVHANPIKKISRNYLFGLLGLLCTSTAFAEIPLNAPDWKEIEQEDNITIYTRHQEGSSFEAFKAVAILNAPFTNIMAVMANPLSCLEWVHGCSKVYGFDENSFIDRYAYSVNDLPWPFKDRDYILKVEITSDPATQEINMHMVAANDKIPANDDYVRVTIAETSYLISPVNESQTKVIWLQHTDPGGVLPGWLVNTLVVDIPVKSLQALEKVAHMEKYQNAEIIYDEQGHIQAVKAPFQTNAGN